MNVSRWFATAQRRLALSIVAGAVVAGAMWLYLNRIEQRVVRQQRMTTVVVAKGYIAKDKFVSQSQVQEIQIPEAYVQPTAIRTKKDLAGTGANAFKARIGLLKGEQITKSKLYSENTFTGLSWMLSEQQTAFSLRLNPEQALAGHLRPGDWVSVLCSMDAQPDWPKAETFVLLPRVQILAVQERVWNPDLTANDAADLSAVQKGSLNEPMLVTLNVHARDSQRLALATGKGKLMLALRSPLDESTLGALPVGLKDLKVRKP